MPFGLGFGELIVVLGALAIPVVVLVLAVKLISRLVGPSATRHDELDQRQMATELQQARQQIEALEARIARVDEKASFTQE
jgi:hypothetical protein